jgi:outer membrane protein, heavy metal efflux system
MRRKFVAAFVVVCVLLARHHGNAYAAFPTLEESIARGRANALVVVEARGQVAIATSTMVGARIAPLSNPYLEVQADRGRFSEDVAINGMLFLPIELHGQRGARIDESHRLTRLKQEEFAFAQASVAGDVAVAYGDVLVSSARLADASRAEQSARSEASYFASRLAMGDVTVFEKNLSEAELARWAQNRAEATIRLIEARAQLAQLMGVADLDAPAAEDTMPVPPTLHAQWTPASLAQLVEGSPMLRALAAEATFWDASRERLSSEKNVPINLIVNGGRGEAGEFRAGGGLSWTLPILRRNQGEIARADAEKIRVTALRDTAKNVVLSRAKAAYNTFVTSIQAVAEQDGTGIPATMRVVDAADALYKAGKGELLRVLIARRDLALARARRLDLVVIAWRAYGVLAALKGDLP